MSTPPFAAPAGAAAPALRKVRPAFVAQAGLVGSALVVYAFLYMPLVIVVVYSFNNSRLNAEWVGFTLDWYRKLFANNEMLLAAGNSLLIALVASVGSTWPSLGS